MNPNLENLDPDGVGFLFSREDILPETKKMISPKVNLGLFTY